ncbi:heptaprenylglyceryl phosphate synthase [Salinirubrum litoreum]|uniref:phosphoglycerol geranylgeranyltransferase n=1 Tax=Salinirubrum litoreum TaxID=1126234 RepID=A0ABD5R6F5_9EURY|nr:heptaprenylglyceryl phosphate synthase [Salinirubrum litoreum]
MNLDWDRIDHVTKVDPAESLPRDLSILRGTDLVMVGGSDDVTAENTLRAVERVREATDVPIWQEPYHPSHVSSDTVEAVDHLSIPAVYNGDSEHFFEKHLDLFTEVGSRPEETFGTSLPVVGGLIADRGREVVADLAEQIVGEGYVIQNLDSKAARVSGVETTYSTEQVAGAALATESFYGFPVFYVEYSGTYGGPEDVEAAARYLDETILLYGGGIDSAERTHEILDAGADAVVVGDCFHDDPERFRVTIP